jgi:stage III sporulation protein AH
MRRVEVKKIMKKNQVIITSLAILIAVAGYLNFADVDLGFKDKETSTDSSSILDDVDYDLTDETALLDENGADGTTKSEVMDTASPGEAVLTGASDFAAQAKVSREQVRSQNKADLQAIISNKDISDEEKQNAINTMVSMTDLTEKEAAAELLLEAKGFENVIVNLTGETADVVVPDADLEDAKRAQIEDIVKRKTGVAAESIVITPLSQSKNASDVINTADEAEKNTGGAEDNAESTGEEVQDTAASVESDPADQTSEDAETAADIQNDQTIDTEGIYD